MGPITAKTLPKASPKARPSNRRCAGRSRTVHVRDPARYGEAVLHAGCRIPDGGNRRLGVFFAGDRLNPSLEIIDDRIIARDEDPETIAALVRLAQHNGWETIDVHGTPEFTRRYGRPAPAPV
jgi:nucleotide-binding universal stress UspA family protein